jgi:6-phosphofructokinase 2
MTAPVLTLTLNPALDRFCTVERVQPQHKLRCSAALEHPGGGGINVARVLHRLGTPARALFPAGGATGARLQALLAAEGLPHEALPLPAGDTRDSLTVRCRASGDDYRFLLPGPPLTAGLWGELLTRVDAGLATGAAALVLSGSLPPGAPLDAWAQLARRARAAGVPVALDSSGTPLREALAAGVDWVKPSRRELEELHGTPLPTRAAQRDAARAWVTGGRARWVALSLGADGALLVGAEQAWWGRAPVVPVASTIGAGDSLLAGLLHAALQAPAEPAHWLRMALATAAAAVQQPGTALAAAHAVAALATQVQVEALPV